VERIHMTEETLLQMIREGNLEYRNVLDRLTGLELPVQFPAAGQFRRLKNALMIFCGQCTRAAIQGGMPPQTAFAMETEHCDRLERAATMTELLTVNRCMMEDYIRKVHDLRATPDVSKPVKQCCDYIRRHILQPLELSQIARHVGYSEYYLSKRFNREMGIRVVDFIKDERINLAKI
jgi:transcriptional regulator, araC family